MDKRWIVAVELAKDDDGDDGGGWIAVNAIQLQCQGKQRVSLATILDSLETHELHSILDN